MFCAVIGWHKIYCCITLHPGRDFFFLLSTRTSSALWYNAATSRGSRLCLPGLLAIKDLLCRQTFSKFLISFCIHHHHIFCFTSVLHAGIRFIFISSHVFFGLHLPTEPDTLTALHLLTQKLLSILSMWTKPAESPVLYYNKSSNVL